MSDSPAGNLSITADKLFLENLSLLSTGTRSVDGGDINLTLDSLLLLRDRSDIVTEGGIPGRGGNGGNINIVSPFIVAIPTENSDIQANAFEGDGGQVNIAARGVFGIEPRQELTPLSDINASSENGVSGIVAVNALDTSFIQNNLTELPTLFVDSDSLIASSCVTSSQGDNGTFILTGSNLAETPTEKSGSTYSTGRVQPIIPSAEISIENQPTDPVREPSGIYQLADGRLVMSQECF